MNTEDMETVGIEPTSCSLHIPKVRGLPITKRRGVVIGLARVDAEDYDRLIQHRWHVDNQCSRLLARKPIENGRMVRRMLHREIMGLEPGDPRRVDHINRDTFDNRRVNLRIVSDAENAQNQGGRGGSSMHRGVTWDKSRGKWMATAMLDGRRTTIGRFSTEGEAADAVAAWRAKHMPFSAEATA